MFDIVLYKKLSFEDRELVNEYMPKLGHEEINSFMKRLVGDYDNNDILEVNEEIDTVLVFEKNTLYNKIHKNNNFIVPFNIIFNYLCHDVKNHLLFLSIKEYFEICYLNCINKITNEDDKKYIINFAQYLENQDIQNIVSDKYKIGWEKENDIEKKIMSIYVKTNKDSSRLIKKLNDKQLILDFYTYRNDNKRLGAAIDYNVLSSETNKGGFGRNFRMYKQFTKIELLKNKVDIAPHIKNIVYWHAKNAHKHGFDNNTGIIWFYGKEKNGAWQLSSDIIINAGTPAIINTYYTTDGFIKMFNRIKINKKIEQFFSTYKG